MCHCGNTGVERTSNKSQYTNLTLEKKILPSLLPGFEFATFRSRVRRSYQHRSTKTETAWSSNPAVIKTRRTEKRKDDDRMTRSKCLSSTVRCTKCFHACLVTSLPLIIQLSNRLNAYSVTSLPRVFSASKVHHCEIVKKICDET